MSRNVSFGWVWWFAGSVGILFATTAGAQTAPVAATPPATVSTNVQDYSQGFRAFIRMGLPDTSKAKYVKLDYYGGSMQAGMGYGMYELQLAGNAWLISENKDAKSLFVSSTGRTMELFDQKATMKKQEAEARSNAVTQALAVWKGEKKPAVQVIAYGANQWAEAGNWTATDLSRDLARATAFVDKKIKAKSSGAREARYDSFLHSDEPAGQLFIFATFAWQNGKIQEANALAGRLFTLVGDSRKVIIGALNVLANAQLTATVDIFRKTGDWKAYQVAVSELLKKYPAGWRQAGAAKVLADRLQARAAMVEPPAIKGEGLSDEDLKLAAALASESHQVGMYGGMGELWILPQSKAMRGMKDDSAIGRIKARGLKSVPLLIALVPDETLCPLRRNEIGMSTSSSSSDAQKPEAERAQIYYNQMDRPVTRGEISRALLAPLSKRDPNMSHDGSEDTPEEVIEAAKQVYATLKPLTPAAMAKHFLSNGDQNQQHAAINYMLQNDFETNAPVIEAFLLTPPQDESGGMSMMGGYDGGLAQQYVQKRGEKAAEFVEKYIAVRKKIEMPAGMADKEEHVKQMEKQAEREFKTLRALVKKQDLTETVAALSKSGDDNETAMMAYTALGRQPPAKAVPALLGVAVNSTSVTVRVKILQMMPMLRYSGMQEEAQAEMGEAMADATPDAMEAVMKTLADKNKLTIGTNAAGWQVLMADTRAMPGGKMYRGGEYEWTVADMAATCIETLYGSKSPMEQYSRRGGAQNLRPDVAMKVTRARATARLSGKPEDQLPKMPSADDVTAERRKAIEVELLKAAPAALAAMLDKLTDAESLYVAELAGENEAITKAMAPLSRRIVSVKTAPELSAVEAARLQKLMGTMVSTNTLAEMRELCKRQVATGVAFSVTLSSGGLGKGLALNVTPVGDAMQKMYGSSYMSMLGGKGKKQKGLIIGALMNGQNYGHGMWMVDLPAAVAPTGTVAAAVSDASDDTVETQQGYMETMLESQQEQFETAAETFCKSSEALGAGASVSYTGMIPAKPKDEKKGSGDDDDGEAGMMDVMF